MNTRYYLSVSEQCKLIFVGNKLGYDTIEEARRESKRFVDDALPNNTVFILQKIGDAYYEIGYAYYDGDGGSYCTLDPEEQV
jgi:hypothetical protein